MHFYVLFEYCYLYIIYRYLYLILICIIKFKACVSDIAAYARKHVFCIET